MKYFLTLLGVVLFVVIFISLKDWEENAEIINKTEYIVSMKSGEKITAEDVASLFEDGVLGKGEVIEQKREVPAFRKISVSNAIKVLLEKGTENKVVVRTNSDIQKFVITKVDDGKLKIYLKSSVKKYSEFEVLVTYTELQGLKASSASKITCEDTIQADSFYVDANSASNISLANVAAKRIDVEASSAANVKIAGSCDDLEVEVSSASEVDLFELEAKEVEVDASSVSKVKVYATQEIDAEASSMSTVKYKGAPKRVSKNKSSGGNISAED